jgi:hypothetical protein
MPVPDPHFAHRAGSSLISVSSPHLRHSNTWSIMRNIDYVTCIAREMLLKRRPVCLSPYLYCLFYAEAMIWTFPSSTSTSAGSGWLRKRPGLAVKP